MRFTHLPIHITKIFSTPLIHSLSYAHAGLATIIIKPSGPYIFPDLGLTNCPTAICHPFMPVYEHGCWRSVYEYDRRLTKSSIETAGTRAIGLLLPMGFDSDDLLLHIGLAGNDLLLHMGLASNDLF